MTRKVNWGVIGSGGIARRRTIPEGLLPASNAKLVGVYDCNQEENAAIARSCGVKAFTSLDELHAAEIDAVYVATPVFLHREQVVQCVSAGKHVLCEKPLAMTVQEGREIVTLAKKFKVQVGIAFMMRFHAQHQEALKIIRSGALGKPVYARAQLSCWYPPIEGAWRQDPGKGGGGCLADMGVHCIDLLEMFFGPVASVYCHIANLVHNYPPEDAAIATLRFKNGASGTVDTSFCIPDECSQNALELYGSQGSILAQGTIGQGVKGRMLFYSHQTTSGYDAQQGRDSKEATELDPAPVNTYRAEIEEFSQAILEGRESALCVSASARSQTLLAACYESARTSKAVLMGDSW